MTPWIRRLIVANAIVFLLTYSQPGLADALAFVPGRALAAPWTIVTYMFVHAGLGHIFWNMFGLAMLGPRVEVRLGGPRFLGLYFVGGISGALLSIALSSVGIVGASAAVCAVMLAYALYWPRDKVLLFLVIPIPALVAVLLFVVVSVFGGFGYLEPGVAHWAHLGGIAGGYLYLLVLRHRTGAERFRAKAAPVAPVPRSPETVERWKRIDAAALHPVNREELERIRAKLDAGGPGALSPDERSFLDRFSAA